mmetsp:Transcript_94282/g.275729  ORF Transcript_94282/g.275729 Transcript_94282/m.275729 type:complete len:233 (+) Transcript_94282:333-1031(+)
MPNAALGGSGSGSCACSRGRSGTGGGIGGARQEASSTPGNCGGDAGRAAMAASSFSRSSCHRCMRSNKPRVIGSSSRTFASARLQRRTASLTETASCSHRLCSKARTKSASTCSCSRQECAPKCSQRSSTEYSSLSEWSRSSSTRSRRVSRESRGRSLLHRCWPCSWYGCKWKLSLASMEHLPVSPSGSGATATSARPLGSAPALRQRHSVTTSQACCHKEGASPAAVLTSV